MTNLPWKDPKCARQIVDFVRTLGGSRMPALGLFADATSLEAVTIKNQVRDFCESARPRLKTRPGQPDSFANILALYGCILADGHFGRWPERMKQANDFRGFRFRWFLFAEHMAVWPDADFDETAAFYFSDPGDVPSADVTRILNLGQAYVRQIEDLFAPDQ